METLISFTYVVFFLSEIFIMVIKRARKSDVKIRKDRYSNLLLWTVIILSIGSGIILARRFPFSERSPALEWTGISIFYSGLFIRWSAIRQLGRFFTVIVSISTYHKIKDDGLYTRIRHPGYLGLILEFLGFSFLFNSWYPLPVINIPVFLILLYRITIEEKLLISHFGTEYINYMRRTRRIIPFIY